MNKRNADPLYEVWGLVQQVTGAWARGAELAGGGTLTGIWLKAFWFCTTDGNPFTPASGGQNSSRPPKKRPTRRWCNIGGQGPVMGGAAGRHGGFRSTR